MTSPITILFIALVSYLLGSIPFGLLISKLGGEGDIRNIGSGNIGATNVLRTGRKDLAALTLLADALKGIFGVLIAWFLTKQVEIAALAALFAILGHCFPVWLKFNGGKGVATFVGVTFALSVWMGLVMAISWLLMAFVFRQSSLAAMASLIATCVAGFILLPVKGAVFVVLLCMVIAYRHKGNIRRLVAGTEPKIGQK